MAAVSDILMSLWRFRTVKVRVNLEEVGTNQLCDMGYAGLRAVADMENARNFTRAGFFIF